MQEENKTTHTGNNQKAEDSTDTNNILKNIMEEAIEGNSAEPQKTVEKKGLPKPLLALIILTTFCCFAILGFIIFIVRDGADPSNKENVISKTTLSITGEAHEEMYVDSTEIDALLQTIAKPELTADLKKEITIAKLLYTPKVLIKPLFSNTAYTTVDEDQALVTTLLLSKWAQWLVAAKNPSVETLADNSMKLFIERMYFLGVGINDCPEVLKLTIEEKETLRRKVQAYLFAPDVFETLYALHKETFFTKFKDAVEQTTIKDKPLTPEQKKAIYGMYAAKSAQIARGLAAYNTTPLIAQKIQAWLKVEEAFLEAQAAQKEATGNYARLQSAATTSARDLKDAERAIFTANATVKQLTSSTQRSKEILSETLRNTLSASQGIDNNTLIYIATLAYKCSVEHSNSKQALIALETIFAELNREFTAEAEKTVAAPVQPEPAKTEQAKPAATAPATTTAAQPTSTPQVTPQATPAAQPATATPAAR